MNIQEMYLKLNEALVKLNQNDIDDHAKLDLEILSLQLKKQIVVGGFDPLKDIGKVTVADVSKLPSLIDKLDTDIEDEKKRTALVTQIVSIAKIALKAAGLPILS